MKILNIRRCSILTQFAELEQKAIRLELETVFPVPGISWNLLDPGITKHKELYIQGPGTKEDGYLAYYEICVNIIEDGWSIGNPYPGVMGPYAHKENTVYINTNGQRE